MTSQYFNNERDIVSGDVGPASLPLVTSHTRVLESDFVNLRFTASVVDGARKITRLLVEARNPKVSGESRVFDLTSILPEVYKRHAATVDQIVDPGLSMEARLDALKIAAINMAGLRDPFPAIHEISYGLHGARSGDGLEPSFSIKSVVLSELSDVLRGFSRRGVTVVRNEEPWVQFQIIERVDRFCDASLVILPSGLELPLLDRCGQLVSADSLNGIIHDLTHVLQKGRYKPELEALDEIAAELTARLRRNPDAPEALKKRNFSHEILLAARDGVLWARDDKTEAQPQERHYAHPGGEPLDLPDGRLLWLRHRSGRVSSEVLLCGNSLEGAPFQLTFHYPRHAESKLAKIVNKLRQGSVWPKFRELTDLLHAVPRSAFSLIIPKSSDNYPTAVNSFLRETQARLPDASLERGLPLKQFERFDEYLPDMVLEFVRGRLPFHSEIQSTDPSESWSVLGFLDADLRGNLYAVNALGGSIVVREPGFPTSTEYRRKLLLKFFSLLSEHSSSVTHNPNFNTGLAQSRRNLPDKSWSDAHAYSAVGHIASLMWESLRGEVGKSFELQPGDVRWHAKQRGEGVWSVSLLTSGVNGAWLPRVLNCTVTPSGVVEVAYSGGSRGIFGTLLGRRVWSEGERIIPDHHVRELIGIFTSHARGALGVGVREAVGRVSPLLQSSLLPWSRIPHADPDQHQNDRLARLWETLKGMW